MFAVFDTSAVMASSPELTSPAFESIFANSSRLGIHLLMPEVVHGELINKFEQRITDLHDKVVDSVSEFESKTGYKFLQGMTYDIVRHAVHDYGVRIDKRFIEAGGIYLEYPSVGHEDIARMDMKGKKPFGENKTSYRDALIWFSVLDILRKGKQPIIFVTNNTRDFAASKNSPLDLHPDLVEQLRSYDMKGTEIELMTSVEDFNRLLVVPLLEIDESLSRQLQSGFVGNLNLRAEMQTRLDQGLKYLLPKMNSLVLSVPQPAIEVSYGGIGDLEILESRINRIKPEEMWISLRLEFAVTLIVQVDPISPAWRSSHPEKPTDVSLSQVVLSRPGHASIEMIIQAQEERVSSTKMLMLQIGKWFTGGFNASLEEFFKSAATTSLGFGDTDEDRWLKQTGFDVYK